MAEIEKTLLDDLTTENPDGVGQSLEELLGMAESQEEHVQSLLVKEAERGDQEAIWSVGISYLYGKNDFPQDTLEGIFWLSQSNREEAPLHIADYYQKQGDFENMKEWYLKVAKQGKYGVMDVFFKQFELYRKGEKKNLDYAEQSLEIMFELETDEVRRESLYSLAMALGTAFGENANVPKCIEWLKRANGHVDAELMGKLFEWIYKNVLKNADSYKDYCWEAVDFLEKRLETKEDSALSELLINYYSATEKWLEAKDAEALLKEAEKSKSTVLRIPDGYTYIDNKVFQYIRTPYIKSITEIILPETVSAIGKEAFEGCCNLTRINLPKRLRYLGKWALKGSTLKGFFMKTVKSNNVIENLTIPGNTKLAQDSLGDISGIGCLRFEEGRTEMDWMVFYSLYQETKVGEMYLPASMKKLTNTDAHTNGLYIEKLYAPRHLKNDICRLKYGDMFTKIHEIIYF